MSSSKSRRRFSDSQVRRSNLLPELETDGGSSADREHQGAFETIGHQLELEEKLHVLSQQLLQSYKETQQWASVGQLAQGLIASSQRVGQLKQQLESLRERSGGLFLESIRERSLPREDDHANAANQSLEEHDTTEVAVYTEGSSEIPVEPDTPVSWGRSEQASEFIQPSVNQGGIANALSVAADLLPVPTAPRSKDGPESDHVQEQEAGVKVTTELSESLESKPAAEGVVESDSLPGVIEKEEVVELEQPFPITELDKDNINSSAVGPPGSVRGETHTPPCEDASSDNVLVGVDTTVDQVETAKDKLEFESTSAEPEREETIVPPTTLQATAGPVEENSNCQEAVVAEKGTVSELDRKSAELESEETIFGPSEIESPLPSLLPATEVFSSEYCLQGIDERPTQLSVESEGAQLDHSTPQTTPDHTELNSDHQQTIEQGDTTLLLTVESPGGTHISLGADLEPTKSASSIDREFGIVDECLDELTSEIEALVIASELSSETSEQFFSPPESITAEVEYQDPQPETKLLEETVEVAATIDQVVLLQEEKVEEKGEREKSPGSARDSGEEVEDIVNTEQNFEGEKEGHSEKENSPEITCETEGDHLKDTLEIEPKEVNLIAKEEDSGEREESPEVTFESAGEELKETEPKEVSLEVKEEDNGEREKSPEVTFESAGEEEETTGTVDSEIKDVDLSPLVAESDQLAAQFDREEIGPIVESDTTIIEAVAGVQDNQTEEHTQKGEEMEPKLAVRYSVTKSISPAFSGDNKLGTFLYRIDTVSDANGHTRSPVVSKPVEHCLEDFIELREKLLSLEQQPNGGDSVVSGVPQLDLDVCELDSSTHENGTSGDKEGEGDKLVADHESKILEMFLNQVASNPHLQNEPIVISFLSPAPSKAVPSTTAAEDNTSSLSLPTNGVKEQEPTLDDIISNGRVISEDEISAEQDSIRKEVVSNDSPSLSIEPPTDTLKEPAAGQGKDSSDTETQTPGDAQIDEIVQTNGADHDQLGDKHQLDQSAQNGEDDPHKLDQAGQVDQQAEPIDDNVASTSQDGNQNEATIDQVTNAEKEEAVCVEQPTSMEDSPAVTNTEDITVTTSQVTPPVDSLANPAEEVCLLPEKNQGLGSDPADLGDLGDLSKEVLLEVKPQSDSTLPPRQEEDASRELSTNGGEGKEEGTMDNSPSHTVAALSGQVSAPEKEATHQAAVSGGASPVATVEGGLSGSSSTDVAPGSIQALTMTSSVEPNVKSDEVQNTEQEGNVPKDTAVASGSMVVSPTHKEFSPNFKDEEKEREPSLSPSHQKASSFSKGVVSKPIGSPAVASLNGDESDLSPTHSERTSSNATTSSYLYTTDESLSPQKTMRPVPLQRTSSSPIRDSETKLTDSMEERDAFHMSLMPSGARPMSPEGPLEASNSDMKNKKRIKRIGSMPGKIRSSIGSMKRTLTTKKRGNTLNKTSTFDEEGINNVSVLKPLTTQEWDPTCLLEELYSDYKQGLVTAVNPSGEVARHFGYLDKLPTNRSKANVMTKWKRRYFRAQEGNVYYYQDRRAERALGFIHLMSARVVPIPEKLQIQIIPKDGKSIMLKAPDMDELQAWHRALLLEAAHPTMIAPSSPKPALENPTIIIDIGACSVRAGLVREDPYPEIFFPAVCSFDAETFDLIECGHAALLPDNRYKAHQVYPRKVSLRMDRQRSSEVNLPLKAMDAIINTIVMQMDIDPQVAQLVMTLPPTTPEQERDELIELLLGTFGFAGICLQDQTQLALYSYNTTTGIIVDIGNHITVVPYIDGYAIEAGITRLPFGGNAITENLAKLVTMKGMRYFSETEMFINRFIKESLCYISQNYQEDLAKIEEDPKDYIRVVEVDRFQLPDHRKMITLDSSLFKAPEGLFSPHLWGKDVLGLHDIIWKAIQACPIDQRRELSKNIFLSGSSSVIPGLKERLQKEVASMAPTGVAVEVHTRGSYHHAAYCGASVLASLGSFQNYLVTLDDWNTAGVESLRKWTGS